MFIMYVVIGLCMFIGLVMLIVILIVTYSYKHMYEL